MKKLLGLVTLGNWLLACPLGAQALVQRVNCPKDLASGTIVAAQSVSSLANVPVVILACYTLNSTNFSIDNTTTPPTISIIGTLAANPAGTTGQFQINNNEVFGAVTFSGDATVASNGTLTLNSVNGNPLSCGDTTHSCTLTINAKGLVTAASNNTIANGGTSPGGTNGQFQTNNGGSFGGVTFSGDATVATNGVLTLATVNGGFGSCGDTTHSCGLVTNAKGLITGVTNNTIAGGSGGASLPFVTTNTSTTISIVNGSPASFYCNGVNTYISNGTTTITPATGTANEILFIGISCTTARLQLISATNTYTCTISGFPGCDNVVGSNFPDGIIPIAAISTLTNGAGSFTFTVLADLRTTLGDDPPTAGYGIVYTKSGIYRNFSVDSTVLPSKFFGTTSPGSVSGNLPGDFFSDTTNHHLYHCSAPSSTGPPACTTVSTGGWVQVY
jgi:hypothetical protein